MTVSETLNKSRTTGNGVTVAFPANIKIFAATDITVTTINNTTDVLVNTLILNDGGALGFTVVFDTEAETLTVTVNTAPLATEDLQILRVLPLTQTTDFPRATKFPAEANENALDKNTMILQDQQEQLDRSVTLPVESSLTSVELPTPIAENVLGWDVTATLLVNFSFADLGGTLDTVFTNLAAEDSLKFDGTNFINRTPAERRTDLSLVVGVNVQAFDAGLLSIAGLTTAADKMIFTTASDTYAVTDLTAFARTILDDTTAGAVRTTLDVYSKAETDARDLVLGTPQVTTSGTTKDFTISAGAKQITLSLDGVSLSGTDSLLVQLGDAGGIETSGYTSESVRVDGSPNVATSTAGFIIRAVDAAALQSGSLILTLVDASTFTWSATGSFGIEGASVVTITSGSKSLSAELTTVRLAATGANTLDAGKANTASQ